MKRFLRKWLGIEENTQDIEYENKKTNKAMDQSKKNESLLKGINIRVTRNENKLKKH